MPTDDLPAEHLQSLLTENFFYFFLRLRKGHVRKVVETINARFPEETGARVCLQTAGGVLEKTVRHPFGDPANPIDKIRLTAKFKKLSAGVISPQDQRQQIELIDRLADLADIAQIVDCLRGSDAGDAPLRRSNKDNCTKFQLK